MASEFTLDMSEFKKAMRKAPDVVGKGAKTALGDIKDDWVREARDIAPLDKRNLRDQIHGNVQGASLDSFVEVQANATQDTGGRRFNYAYYIHERDAGGRQLRTPGTVKKFLDESGEKREGEWQKWLEEEIREELRKAGW